QTRRTALRKAGQSSWPTRGKSSTGCCVEMVGERGASHSAPKGRQSIAQGASPGDSVQPNRKAPKGRQNLHTDGGTAAPSGLIVIADLLPQGLRPGLLTAAPSGLNANTPLLLR